MSFIYGYLVGILVPVPFLVIQLFIVRILILRSYFRWHIKVVHFLLKM